MADVRHDPAHGLRPGRRRPPSHADRRARRQLRDLRQDRPSHADGVPREHLRAPAAFHHHILFPALGRTRRCRLSVKSDIATRTCYRYSHMAALRVRSAAALLALTVGQAVFASDTRPPQLAIDLQKKYAAIKDFSADFVHMYAGGVLKKQISERGHMLIKKPGKMRWEYTTPEQKLFISDGVKMYTYLPSDKQVIVGSVPQGDQASTPMLFLTGKGDLTRDFAVSPIETPPELPRGAESLKLVPHARQADYDWLVVAVDPRSLAIVGLQTIDAQGGKSSFSFTNLKENVGLADKDF